MVKHQIVQIPTKMSLAIASILKEEFIEDFESYE
jgi:ribosomal protein S8